MAVVPNLVLSFLCFYLFIVDDSRSLTLKNVGNLLRSNDKETSQFSKGNDSTHIGSAVTTISKTIDVLGRPIPARKSTKELIATSEHTYKQVPSTKRRQRRYLLQGSKMKNADITWRIAEFSKKMTHSQQIAILERAFKTWAEHCVLTFTYVNASKSDIVVKFVTGNHGDHKPFINEENLMGHAFYPYAGSDIHLDESKNWVADPNGQNGVSLLSITVHLIGRSLGLRHSSVSDSVMYPVLKNGKNTLADDDIKAIQALYGKCTILNVDAVVTSTRANNLQDKALVFKNEWVWEVDILIGDIYPGYPRKIDDLFNAQLHNEHPFKAVFYEHEYNTYVFMNDNGYFLLHDLKGFPGNKYTYDSSHFPFFKDAGAPDAAFVDPDDYATYHFFKRTQYYKYDMHKYQLHSGYPKAIKTEWPHVPSYLDAAYYNYNEKAYFFIKENKYYKFVKTNSKHARPSSGVLDDIFKNICPI